ncbi:MAG: hypothetical protein Q7R64_01485 [bacterium]|nr:hypothetical protein [bacterium]
MENPPQAPKETDWLEESEKERVLNEREFFPFLETAGISRTPEKPNSYRVVEVSRTGNELHLSAKLLGDFDVYPDVLDAIHVAATGERKMRSNIQTPVGAILHEISRLDKAREDLSHRTQNKFFLIFDFEGNLMSVQDEAEAV